MVKTKRQKDFGTKSYVCRSHKGKTGYGGLFALKLIIMLQLQWELIINFLNPAFCLVVIDQTNGRNENSRDVIIFLLPAFYSNYEIFEILGISIHNT